MTCCVRSRQLVPALFVVTPPSRVFHDVWNLILRMDFSSPYDSGWSADCISLPALGNLPACSLPAMSQWEGIHWRTRWVPLPIWQSSPLLLWVSHPLSLPARLPRKEWQPARNTACGESVSLAFSSSVASSTAQASALKLVDSLPVGLNLVALI